jgi:hypothetical protein
VLVSEFEGEIEVEKEKDTEGWTEKRGIFTLNVFQ